jgi:hydrogenase nickel incorporation protein HypA/HybF
MHELSVAEHILEIALSKARTERATRVENIRVAVGALTTYMDESLRFYWGSVTEDTMASGSTIEFRHIQGRLRCLNCSREFSADNSDFECPQCGGLWTQPLAGNECFVESIDIETDEAYSAGRHEQERAA